MKNHFEKAFEKFDECMELFGKGIDSVFKELTSTVTKETKINIKSGSVIYVGQGVYAKLLSNVDAIVTSGKLREKTINKAMDANCTCREAVCRYRSATEPNLCLDPTDMCKSKQYQKDCCSDL